MTLLIRKHIKSMFDASRTIPSYGTDISMNTAIASISQANFITSPVTYTVAALNVGVNNYNTPAADTTTITVYENTVATTMTCSVNTDGQTIVPSPTSESDTKLGLMRIKTRSKRRNSTNGNKRSVSQELSNIERPNRLAEIRRCYQNYVSRAKHQHEREQAFS